MHFQTLSISVNPVVENREEPFLPSIKPMPDTNDFLFEDLEYFTPRTAGYAKCATFAILQLVYIVNDLSSLL